MNDELVASDVGLRLRRTAFVVLTGRELRLAGVEAREARLRPWHLQLLDRVAERAAQTDELVADAEGLGGTATDVREFVDLLRAHGILDDDRGDTGAVATVQRGDLGDDDGAPYGAGKRFQCVLLPLVVRLVPGGGFQIRRHDGTVWIALTAAELSAFAELAQPVDVAEAHERHRKRWLGAALTENAMAELVSRLVASALVVVAGRESVTDTVGRDVARLHLRQEISSHLKLRRAIAAGPRSLAELRGRVAPPGLIPVVPMQIALGVRTVPLALGTILTYCDVYERGSLHATYDFSLDWLAASHPEDAGRAVCLFSNYMWSHDDLLAASAVVKSEHPDALTIHGGPSTPSYPGDLECYFHDNPHVDICVRGEGEAATAEVLDVLAPSLSIGRTDVSALYHVKGIAFRDGTKIVRTADRERMAQLDDIPSPYLEGLFDAYGQMGDPAAILETNRGCPYGCTFCDWGSNTRSRIRKFALDRVLSELAWCVDNQATETFIADANFGIFERDVEIARSVAELRTSTGYPSTVLTNYAKNNTKHLREIIRTWVSAGILSHGAVSLQSFDQSTLVAVKRKNIKTSRYDELARQFRRESLPLEVDLMMGLPGQTLDTFAADLQQVVDREMPAKVYATEVLPNSPMNDPAYRKEFAIRTAADEPSYVHGAASGFNRVVSSSTFTLADYAAMEELRRVFLICENLGVLRHVARYMRYESGVAEVDFYRRLITLAHDDPKRWAATAFTLFDAPRFVAPPGSWKLLLDEVRSVAVSQLGVRDDTALKTVLTVQLAVLPALDRRFPQTLQLEHDYAQWFRDVLRAKDIGRDWPSRVQPLRDRPPAGFTVDDPNEVARVVFGRDTELGSANPANRGVGMLHSYELASPIARPPLTTV